MALRDHSESGPALAPLPLAAGVDSFGGFGSSSIEASSLWVVGITIGGYDKELRPFIYVDFLSGCWGGRPWEDGLDGNTSMFANMASFSVEVIEAENPLEVLDYEFVPDTGGAGKFRGGMSQRKTWRMLADEGILQVRADRQTHRPYRSEERRVGKEC